MSYINRKNTEEAIRKYADEKHSNGEQIEYINGILKSISVINEQPAADVVEVVRCGYCVNSVPNGLFSVECKKFKCCMSKSNFCSCGAKMDGRSDT